MAFKATQRRVLFLEPLIGIFFQKALDSLFNQLGDGTLLVHCQNLQLFKKGTSQGDVEIFFFGHGFSRPISWPAFSTL